MRILYLIIFSICLSACAWFDKKEPIPAYIRIEAIDIKISGNGTQGSASAKITDAWIYINDNLQGVYSLPCSFPILAEGQQKISIKAGILANGIQATRVAYPFYTSFDTTVTLQPGLYTNVFPHCGYNPLSVFYWLENFEGIGTGLQATSNSSNNFSIETDPEIVFDGNGCGTFTIEPGTLIGEIASSESFVLPRLQTPVYLELDYNINHPMGVGIFADSPGTTNQEQVIMLNPSPEVNGKRVWNKIYIDLTPSINTYQQAISYKIFFGAIQDESINQAVFYFDNIKLVSF